MPKSYDRFVIGPTFNLEASKQLLDDCAHQALWQCTHPEGLVRRLKKSLDAGADPNVQNRKLNDFGSALSKAVQWGRHPEAVQVLLDAGANPMWGPEREIDNRLLTGDEDSGYQGWPVDPLNCALNALAWVVTEADANEPGDMAKLESHLRVVETLLNAGADPNADDPAMCRSCMENFFLVVAENSKRLDPEVVNPLLPLLWRMLNEGELAPRRQRFALLGNWDMAEVGQPQDTGWYRVGSIDTIKKGLQAYGRSLLLDQTLPATAAPGRGTRL